MEANPITVEKIFNTQHQYTVPLFQRSYRWNQEHHWDPLWDDISRQAKDALYRILDPTRVGKPPTHFMGAVVLKIEPIRQRGISKSQIIDGQQRLATLQIVLAVLRDYAASQGDDLAGTIKHLTLNNGTADLVGDDHLKVLPSDADREMFRVVMLEKSLRGVEGKYPSIRKRRSPDAVRIASCYRFFYQQIQNFVDPKNPEDEELPGTINDRLYAIYHAFRTSFYLVQIELEDNDDPQMIFETLNARGEALLPSDLIRNLIFMLADQRHLNIRGLYNQYWQDYETRREAPDDDSSSRFWHIKEGRGRDRRERIDLLIFYDLIIRRGIDAKDTDPRITYLFKAFSDYMKAHEEVRSGPGLRAYLQSLNQRSEQYARLVDPDGYDALALFSRRLKSIDVGTVYPVLLYLMELGATRVPPAEFKQIIGDLESYLVRRTVCKMPRKGYGDKFRELLKNVKAATTTDRSMADLVREVLVKSDGERTVWPSDARFRHDWVNHEMYVESRSAVSRSILTALNDQRRTVFTEGERPSGLEVEHLLPQSAAKTKTDDYPLPSAESLDDDDRSLLEKVQLEEYEDESDEERRRRLIHTVGNLTLLTSKLNKAISNGPFDKKVQEIKKHSILFLNHSFGHQESWNEMDIVRRSLELFGDAKKIWPRPAR